MAGSFEDRKAIGTLAETLLRELLTDSKAIVTAHQQNYDATRDRSGAAVAYGVDGRPYHIPDIEARWPSRGPQSRCFIDAKAKTPLSGGGWGLDKSAFNRVLQWMEIDDAPVFYAIRNTADEPLPPMRRSGDFRDDPDLWSIASFWKLAHSDNRSSFSTYWGWPPSDFMPLRVLLEAGFALQSAPYFRRDLVGDPPAPRLF